MLKPLNLTGWDDNVPLSCVPSAIAILAGIPALKAHIDCARFGGIDDSTEAMGFKIQESLLILREYGFQPVQIDLNSRFGKAPTLLEFITNLEAYEVVMPLFVSIEKRAGFSHVIASHMRHIADNFSKRPVPVREYQHKRSWVTSAWVLQTRAS